MDNNDYTNSKPSPQDSLKGHLHPAFPIPLPVPSPTTSPLRGETSALLNIIKTPGEDNYTRLSTGARREGRVFPNLFVKRVVSILHDIELMYMDGIW